MLTLSKGFDDEGEVEEAEEEDIEFLEAGEDSAEAFEPPEEPLDFVALFVESAVVFPGLDAVGLWRNDRDHAQAEHQLPGFVALVGAIHQQRQAFPHRPQFRQQGATFGSIVRMAGRQGEGYGRSSIRGNQMNLGVPSAARLADGLRSVFFRAPVPSGCTLIEVESSANASILIRTICSDCNFSNS